MDEPAQGLVEKVRHLIAGLAPRVSSQSAARDEIAKMKTDTRPPAWSHLPRDDVAKRALELVYMPDDVKQGGLGLCVPAVFVETWVQRDPLAFAKFVRSLYFEGKAPLATVAGFTPHEIAPSAELLTQDYATVRSDLLATGDPDIRDCPPAEWMVMCALRNDAREGEYDGSPEENYTAGGNPDELAGWLEAALIYTSVTQQSFRGDSDDLDAIEALDPTSEGRDIILAIDTELFKAGPISERPFFASLLGVAGGNHVVKLTSKPQQDGDNIQFWYWSYGGFDEYKDSPERLNRYTYTAVIAEI